MKTSCQEFFLCETIPEVIRDIDTFLENGHLNIHELKTEWLYCYVVHAIKKAQYFSFDDSKLILFIGGQTCQRDLKVTQLVAGMPDEQKGILKVIVHHLHM